MRAALSVLLCACLCAIVSVSRFGQENEFKSVRKFKIFNTNNLWVSLASVRAALDANSLNMDIIANFKVRPPGHTRSRCEVAHRWSDMCACVCCWRAGLGWCACRIWTVRRCCSWSRRPVPPSNASRAPSVSTCRDDALCR